MIDFKQAIITELKKHVDIEIKLEIPPDPKLGDYAFPTFQLAKTFKKSPPEIAQEIGKLIQLDGKFSKISITGPYINFFIDKEELAHQVIYEIFDRIEGYGKLPKKNKKVMVEYSSPNTNKAQHLGHVRNNLLGATLARTLDFAGYETTKTCLMNDKGMGVSKAIYSYITWHNNEAPNKKPDHYVADLYVEFQTKSKDNPDLDKEAALINQRFEKSDPEIMAVWKKITDWVYEGYEDTYKMLGCTFDKNYYESQIYKTGKEIVQRGKEKGIFVEDDGAIIVPLEEYKLPNKILIKSDGTSLYITQDIYLAELKEKDFKIDKSIYVVGSEQELHFKQLFKILELLGKEWAKNCFHLSYGMIELPEGKMKSREGTTVDADDIINEMINLAKGEIKKRHPELSTEEIDKRAEIIGLGALKFFILKYEHTKGFVYNPEESISFEGETGPYIQYVYARIMSIFKKSNYNPSEQVNFSLLDSDVEQKILKLLYNFPNIVDEAAESYKTSIIARYLIDLAQGFSEFYHSSPILKEKEDLKQARLALCYCVKTVIKTGLNLLGIETIDQM